MIEGALHFKIKDLSLIVLFVAAYQKMTQNKAIFLNGVSLIWVLCTPLTALFATYLPRFFHPLWALVTIPILIFIQVVRIRKNKDSTERASKIEASRRYSIILLLVLAFFSGLGIQMGFSPLLFHQIIVYLLVIYLGVDCIRGLSTKTS